MICQKCKVRDATVLITNFINNVQVTMHLCRECAKRFTPGLQQQLHGVDNILMKIMGNDQLFASEQEQENVTCDTCGLPLEEFRKTGKMGCKDCYETFRPKIEAILKRIHGHFEHVGEPYQGMEPSEETEASEEKNEARQKQSEKRNNERAQKQKESVDEKIQNLKKALEEAVQKEEYEEAAKIRDMIKIIEENEKGG